MKHAGYLFVGIILIALIGIFFLFPPTTMSIADIELNPYAWLTEYTTPEDSTVRANLEHIIETDGVISIKDIYDIQEWVGRNIDYVTEEVKYPSETLRTGQGNCWSQASLMYSLVLSEDPDADSYIALINVTSEGEKYTHSSVITYFDDEVIISDTTIGPTVNFYCVLDDQASAVRRIVDGTNVDTYIITHIINLEGEK